MNHDKKSKGESFKHPLLNPSSSHYDQDDKPTIFKLEEQLSVAEMAGFCSGNIFYYEHRLKYKGQVDSDLAKINTYKKYFDVIKSLLHKGYKTNTVSHALELEGIIFEF